MKTKTYWILAVCGLVVLLMGYFLAEPYLFLGGALGVIILARVREYQTDPYCKWCKSRHKGRCMFNPRSGRFLANVNDGFFDYNNPNS